VPFTGGLSPSPERTGGGDAGDPAPRLQRIFESIATRRGPAFDQTEESAVGAEIAAYARAIDSDVYGANERFANEMNPATATVAGLLPRWEKVFGAQPQPGDSETVRQQRVVAAAAKFAMTNGLQGINDAISALLGPLFLGLTLVTPSNAITWWPGLQDIRAKITSITGNQVTIQGLVGVPVNAAGKKITVSNASTPANNGTFLIQSVVSASSVVYINASGVAPDYGVLGTIGAPLVHWQLINQQQPFTSSVLSIFAELSYTIVPGYVGPTGTANGAFYAKANSMNPVLDWLIPADHVFGWYVASSHGGIGFYLDEPDLDLEAFD
jgi:hypothetical protein